MNKGTDIRQLERVIDEWQDRLYSLAFFRLGDEGTAQDVVQEAFIRYYRAQSLTTVATPEAGGQAITIRNPKAWLYRTTLNLATDHLRRRPPIRAVPLSAAASEAAESDELYEEYLRLEQLLAPLPEEQAEVVRLHFTDDLSMAEIAEVLGLSRDTVKSRYRYAMEKLRKMLATSLASRK